LIKKGDADELYPHVVSVLNRGVASVAGTEESILLAWIGAQKRLRLAWNKYKKAHLYYGNPVEEIEFPEVTREQILAPPVDQRRQESRPGADTDSGTLPESPNPGSRPVTQDSGNPPGPVPTRTMVRQAGEVENDAAVKGVKACTLQLRDLATKYMGAPPHEKLGLFPSLKSKYDMLVTLQGLLAPVVAITDWHPVDGALLQEAQDEARGIIAVVDPLLTAPPASTPVTTAGQGPAFPFSLSQISVGGNGTGGTGAAPTLPPQRPHVTAIRLQTSTVTGALQGPPQPSPGSSNSPTGGDPGAQGSASGSTTDLALKAMLGGWFQGTTLDKLPAFEGKITGYLDWREQVVPLLNLDTRGSIPTFITLKSVLKGAAAEKIAHIRATDPEAVTEAIRLLDETYLDQKQLCAAIKRDFFNIPPPDQNDPEVLRSFVSKVATVIRAYTEAGKSPLTNSDLYDQVMDKLHLDLQRDWVKEVKREDRSLEGLLSWILKQAAALAETTHRARQAASGKAPANNRGGGNSGKGGNPQANAVTGGTEAQPATGGPPSGAGGGKDRGRGRGGGNAWSTPLPVAHTAPTPDASGTPSALAGGGPTQGQATGGPPARGGSRGGRGRNRDRANRPQYAEGFCPICNQQVHNIDQCPRFLSQDADGRIHQAFQYGVHAVCLRTCPTNYNCARRNMACGQQGCDRFHHPLTHGARCNKPWYHEGPGGPPQAIKDAHAASIAARRQQQQQQQQQQPQPQQGAASADGIGPAVHLAMAEFGQHLRLMYVHVRRIGANRDKCYEALALQDPGCTRTFIREKLARKMGLTVKCDSRVLNSVHGPRDELMASVSFEIGRPRDPERDRTPAGWDVVARACTRQKMELAGPTVRWAEWAKDHPPFQDIAEQLRTVSYKDVEIYLGIDMEDLYAPIGPQRVSPCGRYKAVCCSLGWTVSGPAWGMNEYHVFTASVGETPEPDVDMEEIPSLAKAFSDFNSLEAVGIVPVKDKYSHRERIERDYLKRTARQRADGRWVIPMLVRDFKKLPPSEPQARKRLRTLLLKLRKDPESFALYKAGIANDLRMGYIRHLSKEEAQKLRSGIHHFNPHFGVKHPDKPGKLRRVNDAAAKNCGISLNGILSAGQNDISPVFDVQLGHRRGKYAVNADIKDHFSQVVVPDEQQSLLAFLWAEDPEAEPEVFVNTRHIFGAKCSPAVAIFALEKATEHDPQLCEIVKSCFYMDDFYYSHDDKKELSRIAHKLEDALKLSGFELGKWMSNCADLLAEWPLDSRAQAVKDLGKAVSGPLPTVKALGVVWDCESDSYRFESRKMQAAVTDVASVLSVLASIFDPLGIVAPYVLMGKHLFQKIWYATKDWKAAVPAELKKQWDSWMLGLPEVATLSVRRWYGMADTDHKILHVFADASGLGYGTAAYLAALDRLPAFVAGRTRVTPMNDTQKMPRLELQAALIGMRILVSILKGLPNFSVERAVLWSDSQTVLHQILNEDSRFEMWHANRLDDIRQMGRDLGIPVEYRHVPTELNPADLASRGFETAEQFKEVFEFWITGPDFIRKPADQWPPNIKRTGDPPSAIKELLALALAATVSEVKPAPPDFGIADGDDDYNAFLMAQSGKDAPTADDLRDTEIRLIRQAQEFAFEKELLACENSKTSAAIRTEGPLRRQAIWRDEDRLLRLITRAVGADCLPTDAAVPLVLPREHPLTALIIRDAHRSVEHQGYRSTHAQLATRWFIPKGLAAVKKICNQCYFCRKRNPKPMRPPTAPLHASRLNMHSAWKEVGMDHFGPFEINKRQKKWGLIFTCLTTRAVHLEDVDGPGAEPFCHALDRFIQRRLRKPDVLRCDRGSAFLNLAAQQNKTMEVYAEEIRLLTLKKFRIDLKFNPAGTPHYGGGWERLITEVKKIVYAAYDACGGRHWRADDFRTFLVRAEGILNRRPIAYAEDGEIITPAKYIFPSADMDIGPPRGDPKISSLMRIRAAEKVFWDKWVKYYLPSISTKQVLGEVRNDVLRPGDKVLLREGSNPLVDSWTHGVIKEVFTTPKDGVVRTAVVTVNGVDLVRDVTRICILDGPVLDRKRAVPPPSRGVSENSEPSTGPPATSTESPAKRAKVEEEKKGEPSPSLSEAPTNSESGEPRNQPAEPDGQAGQASGRDRYNLRSRTSAGLI